MHKEEKTDWVKRYADILERTRNLQEENGVDNDASNIKSTQLSHRTIDYIGDYYNPGHGIFEVFIKNDSLFLHTTDETRQYYLNHYHYDSFEVFNVEGSKIDTSYSEFRINFRTNMDGDISVAAIKIDPTSDAIVFKRIPKEIVLNASTATQYIGAYEIAEMELRVFTKENDNSLYLFISEDQPEFELIVNGEHKFSFKISGVELKVEFRNPENDVFKELILI